MSDKISICPYCSGAGKVITYTGKWIIRGVEEGKEETCTTCEGSGRVIYETKVIPYKG